ncbi:ABC transporter permease [Abyssisolibacter fermentans]|uniref:ABC transporter permease n=1 Tax=Abyssisolibacter fermentans TaxID=1766203 RepID=UPI0008358B69|nr:ABC transporter permease [Abyssisolibacter fermentans]
MFSNNNKKVINKLAKRSFKKNKTRNIFTLIAIILTTVLITSVFTIGMSIVDTTEKATMRQVGTMAHGGFKHINKQQYDMVKNHPLIKEHGLTMYLTDADNKEFRSKPLEIRYSDKNAGDWGFTKPIVGDYPKAENEIVTATWILDRLKVKHEIGAIVTLSYTVLDKSYTKDFVLSGYWEGDKSVSAAGEALVSLDFINQYTALDGYDNSNIDICIMFNNKNNIKANLERIVTDTGLQIEDFQYAVNWAYMSTESSDLSTVLPFVIITLLIMFSGYLLIYNIFYISVVGDIKYYGLLKTIGSTRKQLKRIIRKQALYLSIIGIPIGLCIGYFSGILLVPMMLMSFTINESSIVISSNPLLFVGAGIFSAVTVLISCNKPAKLASKVSPIEAVRYTGVNIKKKQKNSRNGAKIHKMALSNVLRSKKKLAVVLSSLSLSIILFSCVFSMISGFDIDKYLVQLIRGDITIAHYSYYSSMKFDDSDSLSENICDEIDKIDGVKRVDKIYLSHTRDILDNAKLKIMQKVAENKKSVKGNMEIAVNTGSIGVQLYGLDIGCLNAYDDSKVIDGKIDLEKFKTGNYVLINHYAGCDYYKVGDKLTLQLKDGTEKEFEVMALIDVIKTLHNGRFVPTGYKAFTSSKVFKDIVKDPVIMSAQVFADDDKMNDVKNGIDSIIASEPDLEYISKDDYINEYKGFISMFSTVGYTLSGVIALIGLLNFVNTILTGIISRKMEFAMLESIGMTKKQLIKMITFEGLYYGLFTTIIILTLGLAITYYAVNSIGGIVNFFEYNFNVIPTLACGIILIIAGMITPRLCYKSISKLTIIERLRDVE